MPEVICVRELRNRTSRIVKQVGEQRVEYVITVQNRPVAVLRPFDEHDAKTLRDSDAEEALARLEVLAQEVAEAWVSPKSAIALVEEQRR